MKGVLCKRVETDQELKEAYRIRHEIFVEEQKLFSDSDRDEHDAHAIHIVALYHDQVIGTVRVYEKEKGVWCGSRLAVLKHYRGKVGKQLIEEAVKTVRVHQAQRFFAYVQLPNVAFFKRCRWRPVGEVIQYQGAAHQMMEAEL
jgi:putative N-acetyltransferase (TIGR04045 family)